MPDANRTDRSEAWARLAALDLPNWPPDRIARVRTEGGLVRALRATQDAQREARDAGYEPGGPVDQAITAARMSLVEALRRTEGGL